MARFKRFSGRELVLMLAPLIVVGGAALVLTRRENERRARESGPYRTVITRTEFIPVSPVEAWRGFDRKVRIDVELQGQPPQHPAMRLDSDFGVNSDSMPIMLSGFKQGKKQNLSNHAIVFNTLDLSDEDKARAPLVVFVPFASSSKQQSLWLLMNTSAFTSGQVKADGEVVLYRRAWATRSLDTPPVGFGVTRFGSYFTPAQPARFSFVVRRPGEAVAPDVDRSGVEVKALPATFVFCARLATISERKYLGRLPHGFENHG